MKSKIDICKRTRTIASGTLYTTLQNFMDRKSLSERRFRNAWLVELRKNQTIFPDGWYDPPPNGIGVLFGTGEEKSRLNYKSLRSEEMWPKKEIFLNGNNEMAYFYASPVDKEAGIIGDFGLTIYLGNNSSIIDHLKKCWEINLEIFEFIQVGMKFSEVYKFAEKIIAKYGLSNQIVSSTDPVGQNIGHTIPASYFEWSKEEKLIIENGISDWEPVKNMISKKRVFINSIEDMVYQTGMAVTLEPRLTSINNPSIPMSSFHTIVVINPDGSKELLSNFEEIFKLVGMTYMLM